MLFCFLLICPLRRGEVKNSTGGEQPLVNNVHHPDTTDLWADQCVCTVRGFAYGARVSDRRTPGADGDIC